MLTHPAKRVIILRTRFAERESDKPVPNTLHVLESGQRLSDELKLKFIFDFLHERKMSFDKKTNFFMRELLLANNIDNVELIIIRLNKQSVDARFKVKNELLFIKEHIEDIFNHHDIDVLPGDELIRTVLSSIHVRVSFILSLIKE